LSNVCDDSRPSLGKYSKALLKAREAQTILIKPDLTNEDTWQKDDRNGLDALNERCKGEISPGIIFIDFNSAASDTCQKSVLEQTGVKMI